MTEVLENIGRHQLAEHIADLLPAVQVRGARLFRSLGACLGTQPHA